MVLKTTKELLSFIYLVHLYICLFFDHFDQRSLTSPYLNFLLVVNCRKESEGNLKGILGYIDDNVVSTDIVNDHR